MKNNTDMEKKKNYNLIIGVSALVVIVLAIAFVGYHLPYEYTWISFAADALTKSTFGAYLLFLSKPSISKITVQTKAAAAA